MRLLLGVAYVQPKNVIAAGGGKGSFSTGLSDLTEWRMYSRLRVNGNRFDEPAPICVALCSLSGKQLHVANCSGGQGRLLRSGRPESNKAAARGAALPAEMKGVESR